MNYDGLQPAVKILDMTVSIRVTGGRTGRDCNGVYIVMTSSQGKHFIVFITVNVMVEILRIFLTTAIW